MYLFFIARLVVLVVFVGLPLWIWGKITGEQPEWKWLSKLLGDYEQTD